MTRLFITILLLIIFTSLKAQVKALTENGREVILNDNGTWRYVSPDDDNSNNSETITTNPIEFHTTIGATFLVKSNVMNVGVYLDHNKWTFLPHKSNEVNPEYSFEMKTQHGYAMMLTELTPIEIENMKVIALQNAQKVSPDMKVTHVEYRVVNNKKVLCLTMKGTIQGIKFVYFGYYYSNSNGTVQLIAYGSENMFKDSLNDWQDFLNGFTVIK
jgi:hypothetical protein